MADEGSKVLATAAKSADKTLKGSGIDMGKIAKTATAAF
jgi:hypothetical protein